jgi:hypothetical protein
MRLLTAAGLLVFSAGTVLGAYVVDLDGGDRMTVDSYWEEGDRMHLMRGGVDLSVPRSRVRSIKPGGADEDSAGVGRTEPAAPPRLAPRDTEPSTHRELEAQRVRIERHQVRVSREISEAQARGESPKGLRRLQREMDRTWKRRQEVNRSLGETN